MVGQQANYHLGPAKGFFRSARNQLPGSKNTDTRKLDFALPQNNSNTINNVQLNKHQPSDNKKCLWYHKICFLSISLTLFFVYFLYVLFWCLWLCQSKLLQCSFPSHLCKLHRSRISKNWSIRLLVACVPDQLVVPNPEVMLPVCPLGEDGNSRSAHQRQGVMLKSLWWIHTSNSIIQAVLQTPWNQTCDS